MNFDQETIIAEVLSFNLENLRYAISKKYILSTERLTLVSDIKDEIDTLVSLHHNLELWDIFMKDSIFSEEEKKIFFSLRGTVIHIEKKKIVCQSFGANYQSLMDKIPEENFANTMDFINF